MRYRRQTSKGLTEAPQRRRRRGVMVLPTLFTLGNCICGFASMQYASLGHAVAVASQAAGAQGGAAGAGASVNGESALTIARVGLSYYSVAGYLIFAAMLFDLFDGFVARLTRATSDFGAELDSLADMVSFGAAPAFLAISLIDSMLRHEYPGSQWHLEWLGPNAPDQMWKLFWVIGAVYVGCTALRLARFNVRNQHDVDSHMNFRGMPSPGAAGVVASSIIFFEALYSEQHILPYKVPEYLKDDFKHMFPYLMPVVLLIAALLMVSRFPYAHLINRFLRGRRKFRQVVGLFLLAMLLVWQPQITALLAIYIYAISAPLAWAMARLFRRRGRMSALPANAPQTHQRI